MTETTKTTISGGVLITTKHEDGSATHLWKEPWKVRR